MCCFQIVEEQKLIFYYDPYEFTNKISINFLKFELRKFIKLDEIKYTFSKIPFWKHLCNVYLRNLD